MKIVCLGDSITQGFGVDPNEAWPAVAAALTGYIFINRGVCGDTTGQMLARFENHVLKEKPDAAIIIGGVNDIIFIGPHSICDVQTNLSKMAFKAHNHGIVPVVGTYPNVCETTIDGCINYETVNLSIRKCREFTEIFCKTNKIGYIDFNSVLQQGSVNHDMKDIIFDGLHPNKNGHRLMAEAIAALPLFHGHN